MRGGARWVTAGLADQVVIASANAGNILLALALLNRHRAGILALSIGVAYLVMGINRAFVGDTTHGQIRVIKNGALLTNAALTLAVDRAVERGIEGIAFAPDFATAAADKTLQFLGAVVCTLSGVADGRSREL